MQIADLAVAAAGQALRRAVAGRGPRAGQPSRYVLLGLGKLGGREMSYHSDLDLILVYEGDGRTGRRRAPARFDTFELTDNFHFFTELARQHHQGGQLSGADGPALPGRHAAAADRQVGQPGHPAHRVPPLLRGGRRPALGTAGADAGPRRLRRRRVRPRT